MTLRNCPPGREVVVRHLGATTAGSRRRLLEWGFVPGARIRPVARGPAGGLIVALADARVAVDARIAAALVVEPV
jgi:Fe2+ transport system protein FeoA